MTLTQQIIEIIESGFTVIKNDTEIYKTNRKKAPYEIYKKIKGDIHISKPSVFYVTYGENEVFENFYNSQDAAERFIELSRR